MSKEYSYEKGNFTDKYDGLVTGRYVIAADVDGYIYKNYESILGHEVSFKDHLKCMIEANAGAHYYADGPYTGKFSRTSALIDLKKLKINRRDTCGRACRNA
jgi:hypothetical protein